jgi:hypothetical protein
MAVFVMDTISTQVLYLKPRSASSFKVGKSTIILWLQLPFCTAINKGIGALQGIPWLPAFACLHQEFSPEYVCMYTCSLRVSINAFWKIHTFNMVNFNLLISSLKLFLQQTFSSQLLTNPEILPSPLTFTFFLYP